MALRKQNISIGPDLERYLATRLNDGGNVSGTLNTLAQRYGEVVERTLPAFTTNEWLLLFDVLRVASRPDDPGVFGIPGLVRFDITHKGAADKWGIDGSALMQRLDGLSLCELYALLDASVRFWRIAGSDSPGSNSDRVARTVGPGRILLHRA